MTSPSPDPATNALLTDWDEKTYAFLHSQSWDSENAMWLVCVSGGADSIALLYWAQRACARHRCKLAVAHVNHGLRPTAKDDQHFVFKLCAAWEIPCYSRNLNSETRPSRESLEMWGRRERYSFFSEAAQISGADWILTAHHRDDLVETVFQRLGRGTGPRGLKGIPFCRGNIVRPLLNRSKAEILSYLQLHRATWKEDESNADVRIDRNWYRHRYLPSLRKQDPDLEERIFNLAMSVQSLAKAIDHLENEAALLKSDAHGNTFLDRHGISERIQEIDLESLAFWLRKLVSQVGELPVTKEILLEVCRQWKKDPETVQVPLSPHISLKMEDNGLYCRETALQPRKQGNKAKKAYSLEPQKVILERSFLTTTWRWEDRNYSLMARRYPKPTHLEYPAANEDTAIFDADLFSCTLLIRTRMNGDRFSPLGVKSYSRKLKTFFNEKKVPVRMREKIPIVLTGETPGSETPAWVPGYGISDFFKVSGSTSHILELVIKCQNP